MGWRKPAEEFNQVLLKKKKEVEEFKNDDRHSRFSGDFFIHNQAAVLIPLCEQLQVMPL